MANELTKKDKLTYWGLFIFLTVFGLIMLGASIFTLLNYPFHIVTIVYVVGTFGGFVLCVLGLVMLIKEYRKRIAEDKERRKNAE